MTHDADHHDETAWHADVVRAALPHYPGGEGASWRLLCLSENATYRIDLTDGRRTVLRVNRPGYHSPAALASEVAWVRALRAAGVVSTADVVPTRAGADVVTVDIGRGRPHHAVMSAWLDGREPAGEDLPAAYATVGALTARLHDHARRWRRPAGFTRFTWSWDEAVGDAARWGRWEDGPGMGAAERALTARAVALMAARLGAYGTSADRFGLIHGDMRPANLLVQAVDDERGAACRVHVIDFDDCGHSWYLFDLAAALSFLEADPGAPALAAAWLDAYRAQAPLTTDDEGIVATLVLLRRLMLLAWIGTHAETAMAASVTPGFAEGTCVLADRYVTTGGASVW